MCTMQLQCASWLQNRRSSTTSVLQDNRGAAVYTGTASSTDSMPLQHSLPRPVLAQVQALQQALVWQCDVTSVCSVTLSCLQCHDLRYSSRLLCAACHDCLTNSYLIKSEA